MILSDIINGRYNLTCIKCVCRITFRELICDSFLIVYITSDDREVVVSFVRVRVESDDTFIARSKVSSNGHFLKPLCTKRICETCEGNSEVERSCMQSHC